MTAVFSSFLLFSRLTIKSVQYILCFSLMAGCISILFLHNIDIQPFCASSRLSLGFVLSKLAISSPLPRLFLACLTAVFLSVLSLFALCSPVAYPLFSCFTLASFGLRSCLKLFFLLVISSVAHTTICGRSGELCIACIRCCGCDGTRGNTVLFN